MPRNTRFALGSANQTCASTATLINGASSGTYPSRPALSEDSQYPMSNLKINDRAAIWKSSPVLTGQYDIEWDLGSDKTIDVVAVHGFRWTPGQVAPADAVVSFRTSTAGYSQAGTWTAIKTLTLGVRDVGLQLSAPIRGRYFRFRVNAGGAGGGFTIGNFYLGQLSYDLGFISSPGLVDRPEDPDIVDRTMARAAHVTRLGDPFRSIILPFSVRGETKLMLDAVAAATVPTTYLDHEDTIAQVMKIAYERSVRWIDGEKYRWDIQLEMESLA